MILVFVVYSWTSVLISLLSPTLLVSQVHVLVVHPRLLLAEVELLLVIKVVAVALGTSSMTTIVMCMLIQQ